MSDNESMDFIDMIEENPCLWDAFHKDYSKRDVKAIAYSSLATAFEINVSSITTEVNGLHAQLGQQKAKESKKLKVNNVRMMYLHCNYIISISSFFFLLLEASNVRKLFVKERSIYMSTFKMIH